LSHPILGKSRVPIEISAKTKVSDSTALSALVAVLFLAVACALLWRSALRARRLAERLQKEVARLEGERAAVPSLRVTFEFNATTREALVHVSNDGGGAVVGARMSVEGALAQRMGTDLRAAWLDANSPTVSIARGEMRTLRVAELDLSVFPFAQWQIFCVRGDERISVRAMNTSMIGGDPDTHAPPLFVQIAVASSPAAPAPPPECTIALQPFEAVRLRPV
jgi:hypothetical protein